MKKALIATIIAATATLSFAAPPKLSSLQDKVRHELVMLPYLTIFDDLSFRVDGSTVTLFGEVTKPVLKSDAQRAVERVEGVTHVANEIEVLPLSSMDDHIRMQEARVIFGYPALERYRMGAWPSIHIIVKNGNVTLTGAVQSDMDKQLAFTRANGVPGVFAVNNQLQVVR